MMKAMKTILTCAPLAALLLAAPVCAQTVAPTAEEMLSHNNAANQTQADKTRLQNLEMQQHLQADKVQRDYNFAPNPYVLPGAPPYGAYAPPPAFTPAVPVSPPPR